VTLHYVVVVVRRCCCGAVTLMVAVGEVVMWWWWDDNNFIDVGLFFLKWSHCVAVKLPLLCPRDLLVELSVQFQMVTLFLTMLFPMKRLVATIYIM
jgi:hypothetical protein